MSGYVRAYRKALGHPVFRDDGEAMAFIWLTMRAAWRPATVRYKDRVIDLRRAELVVSVRDMASALGRSKDWATRFISRLESAAMIATVADRGLRRITICNYDEYQGGPEADATPSATPTATGPRQGRDTEQRIEEIKEGNITPQKRGGGKHLIPEDWEAPAVADLPPKAQSCAKQWTRASYETEAEGFHLYWRSERKMKADWRATWAGWVIRKHSQVMRDQKFGNAPTSIKPDRVDQPPEFYDRQAEWFADKGMNDDAERCRRKAKELRKAA